jgi:ABC-type transport system involved in multi-copper enzyme maturation permease subunit
MTPSVPALRRVAALARNTFREAIRDKILHSLLFFAVLLILAAVVLGQLSLHEEGRLVLDVGLGGISLFAVLIAIFVGSSLVYKEIERKTVYTIIPKPLRRREFILGKFFGMAAVLAVLLAVMTAVLLAVGASVGAPVEKVLAKATLLLYVEALVVTAVAVLFSSFSTPFLSALFTVGIFVLGRSTSELETLSSKLGAARAPVHFLARVLPDLHLFYVSGDLVAGERVSVHETYVDWSYVLASSGYGLGYAAILLVLAAVIFGRRDFV